MHTSDLTAQLTAIAVASVGMLAAWFASRRLTAPRPAPDPRAERPK